MLSLYSVSRPAKSAVRLAAEAIHLFEATVAAAHSGSKNEKRGFLHASKADFGFGRQ
jgi:hypothetical protein